MNVIKYILISCFTAMSLGCMLCSCEGIDEVPPVNESTTDKSYRVPDPVPMTASDIADYNSIREEYEQSTNSK